MEGIEGEEGVGGYKRREGGISEEGWGGKEIGMEILRG